MSLLALRVGVLLVVPVTLAAQQSSGSSLDISSSRMRFADSIDASAVSLTPAFRSSGSRGSFSGLGTYSQLSGWWSASGLADATVILARTRFLSAEAEGIAGGSQHSDGGRTGQLLGLGRLHLASPARGIWVGGGGGNTWDGAWRAVVQGDAGAWIASDASSLAVRLSPTMVDDTIRYADTFLAARHETFPWELSVTLGARSGDRIPTLPANRNVWGSVGAVFWMARSAGLVAGAGTYPVDFTQGFPGGRFVTFGLRFRSGTNAAPAPAARAARGAEAVRAFQARRTAGSSHSIRIFAPEARSVELTGDFTEWRAVPLRSDGRGWWTATFAIPNGIHELNVRVNGGDWLVPPGLTSAKDEFGVVTGVLVVR